MKGSRLTVGVHVCVRARAFVCVFCDNAEVMLANYIPNGQTRTPATFILTSMQLQISLSA